MIALRSVDALVAHIAYATKDLQLEVTREKPKDKIEKRSPQILDGWLGDKGKKEEISDFPFVLVRCGEIKESTQQAEVEMKIIIGTFSYERDGYRDNLLVYECIKEYLYKKRLLDDQPNEKLEGSYTVLYPVTYKMPEEQAAPQWLGEMKISLMIAKTCREYGVKIDERTRDFLYGK